MAAIPIRKIIHIDMDAFYASVEQRDNPELRGKAIAVGHAERRGVVSTASYEARKHGIHSAMASVTAKRLYPDIIFVAPRFNAYRAVSLQIREIFATYTDLIEPVSLDEAYLDVTTNKLNIPSAWTVAQRIRDEIYKVTGLTASAGVSYNKFFAKIASDLNKPNGQYLITPDMGQVFIDTLPIEEFHGIGPATARKMDDLAIHNGAELKVWSLDALTQKFGKLGKWYYSIARGIDERPVEPNRERKSTSSETTFPEDVFDKAAIDASIQNLVHDVWAWVEKTNSHGRTVTVKIKWADFEQSTRSKTADHRIDESSEFQQLISDLIDSVFPVPKGIRLIGVGISNFDDKPEKERKDLRQASFDFTQRKDPRR